jgi:hypothetical protein
MLFYADFLCSVRKSLESLFHSAFIIICPFFYRYSCQGFLFHTAQGGIFFRIIKAEKILQIHFHSNLKGV